MSYGFDAGLVFKLLEVLFQYAAKVWNLLRVLHLCFALTAFAVLSWVCSAHAWLRRSVRFHTQT